MTTILKQVATFALACLLLAGASSGSRASERVADPAVWGVYANLLGTTWKSGHGVRAAKWGQVNEIIEEDSTYGRSVITPGGEPGTLMLKTGAIGRTFRGTIAQDGSVLWVGTGLIKTPYRVRIEDGRLVEDEVKLNGNLVTVKRSDRYTQLSGPSLLEITHLGSVSDPKAGLALATTDNPAPAIRPSLGRNGDSPGPGVEASTGPRDSTPVAQAPVAASPPPSPERFGIYGRLLDLRMSSPDGTWAWLPSPSGKSIVAVILGPDGSLLEQSIIQPKGDGSLLMVRTGSCPDGVCAQVGMLGVGGNPEAVYWKQPKDIGGQYGEYLDIQMWLEDGNTLVIRSEDPRPPRDMPEEYKQPSYSRVRLQKRTSPEDWPAEAWRADIAAREGQFDSTASRYLAAHMASLQAQQNEREKRERSQERVRAFNSAMGAIYEPLQAASVQATAQGERSRAELDATLARAAAIADAQRQAPANTSALRERGDLRAQPGASPTGAQASAGITVAAVQAPPTPVTTPKTAGGVSGFIGCHVLKPGSFDSYNGAWFFSEIVPTTIVYGKVQDDPGPSFLSKVRATYGITGGVVGCERRESRSDLEAFLAQVGARGYGKHKRVQTGLAP